MDLVDRRNRWLAGLVMRGGGFGILWNIISGIVGGFVGGWILRLFGMQSQYYLVTAFVGAVVILWLATLFKTKT
ncbi:MAG: GlsB/YeaQ/YmgE family stress response membrane protein [Flavobacteriales bacterium]